MSAAVCESAGKTPAPSTYSIMRFQYDPIVVPQIGSCGFSSPESAIGTNGGSTSRRIALSSGARMILRYSAAARDPLVERSEDDLALSRPRRRKLGGLLFVAEVVEHHRHVAQRPPAVG